MIETFTMSTRTKIEELKDIYCDYHKDVHGIKARWVYGQDLTEAELEEMLERLAQQYKAVRRIEQAEEERCQADARKQIQQFLSLGAPDVATAIRWMHDVHKTSGDHKDLDWELGTGYGWVEDVLKNGIEDRAYLTR